MKIQLLVITYFLCYGFLFAQHKIEDENRTISCGYEEAQATMAAQHPDWQKQQREFETYYRANHARISAEKSRMPVTIPVVVHIVHNGAALGTEANLSDDQVATYINQAAERFRHQQPNAGTYANSFYGADTEIDLCLATTAPDGSYSSGITRHYAPDLSVGPYTDLAAGLDAFSWDKERYCNLIIIPNLTNACGVYMGFYDFTIYDSGCFWSGLIAHEIGHYFSLKHTFDGCENNDCLADGDFVCDTPAKGESGYNGGSSSTCMADPAKDCGTDENDTSANNPYRSTALGGRGEQPDMLENYMDYTGGCWDSFTEGQKTRMHAQIQNNRAEMTSNANTACASRPLPDTDAGITLIRPNQRNACTSTFPIAATIKNYGAATLTQVSLNLAIDGRVVLTEQFDLNLDFDEEIEVQFEQEITIGVGSFVLSVGTANPNSDATDANNYNNDAYTTVKYLGGSTCAIFDACTDFNANTADGEGNTTVVNVTGSFVNVHPSIELVEICVTAQGDVSSGSEVFRIYDEDGTARGLTNTDRDCRAPTPPACFTVPIEDYIAWKSDGTITLTFDPASTSINPGLCNTNEICAYVNVPQGASQKPNLVCDQLGTLTVDDSTIQVEGLQIKNTGEASVLGAIVGYYLSEDTNITTTDYLINTFTLGTLEAGAIETLNVSIAQSSLSLPNGTYYLGLSIDYLDYVTESNENDNSCYWDSPTIMVDIPESENRCNAVAPLRCGDSVQSTTTGENNFFDEADYADVYDGNNTYPSADKTYKIVDVPAGHILNINLTGLSANLDLFLLSACTTEAATCIEYSTNAGTLDELISISEIEGGSYYIVVDGQGADTGDFDLSVECIDPAQLPNLFCGTGGSLQVSATTIQVTDFEVSNSGLDPAASFTAEFYLSTNTIISTADTRIGTITFEELAGNSVVQKDFMTNIENLGLARGSYYFGVIIDRNDDIFESNEADNRCYWSNPKVLVGGTADPARCDAIALINCGQQIQGTTAGQSNDFDVVDYQSCYDGSIPFQSQDKAYKLNVTTMGRLSIELSNLSADLDLFVLSECAPTPTCVGGSLKANQATETVTVENAIGTYYIIIEDYAEVGGTFTLSVNCEPAATQEANLVCDDIGTLEVDGLDIRIANFKVKNTGMTTARDFQVGFYASTDTDITTDDALIGTINIQQLAANETTNKFFNKNLESLNLANGNYYVGVLIDKNNNVTESNEADNSCYWTDPKVMIQSPQNEARCNAIAIVNCGQTIQSHTSGQSNDFELMDYANCNKWEIPYQGKDKAYRLNVPSTRMLTIKMNGLSADLDLFVLSDCGASTATCVGMSALPQQMDEYILIENAVGDYVIVVEDYEDVGSAFSLSVSCPESLNDGTTLSLYAQNEELVHPKMLKQAVALEVYPNPSSGSFTAKVTSQEETSVRIEIIDAIGRSIISYQADATYNLQHQFDLSDKENGVYFLRMTTANTVQTQQIVLAK